MNQSPVFRQVALPVPVFDYIKDFQRAHLARLGQHLTINQTITAIVMGHQQLNEECEAHERASKQSAIPRS